MVLLTRIAEAYKARLDQLLITNVAVGHSEHFTARELLCKVSMAQSDAKRYLMGSIAAFTAIHG